MNTLVKQLYIDSIRQLNRGNYRGIISNAKPYLLISILDAISDLCVKDNTIYMDDIKPYYQATNAKYSPDIKPSPLSYPFYHLGAESFYHLQWRNAPIKKDAPSGKFVRDNIEYAYFDEALWELLQDKSILNEFRTVIENYYLK